jgi:AraC-like DNA-binding protein
MTKLSDQPRLRISAPDLESLLNTLIVRFAALSKCLVVSGHRLELGGVGDAPGIHYNLSGTGELLVKGLPAVGLRPHTLVIVPPNTPITLVAAARHEGDVQEDAVDGPSQDASEDGIRKFVAGNGEPELILVCGYFHASYGSSAELFGRLASPIVEQFSDGERIGQKLEAALSELVGQEIGAGAMSSALLMQVIIALLRKSLTSVKLWMERFSMLGDPQVARALSGMISNPGGPHAISSLASGAGLSRSVFMARFVDLVGHPPMAVLRDLRMHEAAAQLRAGIFSIDQVAHNVGYRSRTSFARTFASAFGTHPSEYRAKIAMPKKLVLNRNHSVPRRRR